MSDPKHSSRDQGTADLGATEPTGSHIRPHEVADVVVPRPAAAPTGLTPRPSPIGHREASLGATSTVDDFMDEWALRHFTISVKLHDVGRFSEGDPERQLVLEDLAIVQGVLLEVHDFVLAEERMRALMRENEVLQNGVGALYGWLGEVLDAAARLRVTRGKPGFFDTSDATLGAILRTLERVHPDLEVLLRIDTLDVAPDLAQKIALCFRQIGAAVVRVSGRSGSSYPGPMTP